MPETIELDPSRVPERLRKWIPLAQRWGHSDDGVRDEIVDGATREELDDLLALLDADESDWDALTAWLVGPEAKTKVPPTEEYVAFTCLTMALDLAKVRRKREDQPDAFRTRLPPPSATINAIIREQYSDRPQLRAICDAIIDAAKAFQSLGNRGDPAEAAGEVVIFAAGDLVELATRRRSFARIQPGTDGSIVLYLRLEARRPVGRLKPCQSDDAMPLQISIASLDEWDGEAESWLHQAYKENR